MLILSLLSLIFIFSACKKEDGSPTKTELLTLSLWKMTAFTMDDVTVPGTTNNIFVISDNYTKDDTHKFNADKTMIIDDGMLKCESSDPQAITGTWSFNSNETVLTSTVDGEILSFTLLELTDKILKLKYTEDSYTYAITFSH